MRILLVNSYYYPEIEGGAEYSVKMLAETLVKNGHAVSVICTAKENTKENIEGVDVYRIRSKCLVRTKDCYKERSIIRKLHRLLDIYNPFNFEIFNHLVKEIKPDVIHCNGLYDISPIIWKVARINRIRTVHTLRDYCLICVHSNMRRRKTGDACQAPSLLCKVYRKINAFQTRNVDVVTAPSQFTLETVCNTGLFKKAEKAVVFNATDIDLEKVHENIERRKSEIGNKSTFTFVFVGTFVEFKGVKWLIESFKKTDNQDLRLLLCGKGELTDYVTAESKKDPRIEYRGFLRQKELREVLRESDVLICPSLWDEPFGRVILDAYQAGIPVIASNVGALPSIVKDGETGIIVDTSDEDSLFKALDAIKTNNFALSLHIEEFLKNFTLETQYMQYLDLYC